MNENLQNKNLYCAICGKQSESRNYNVISCTSCKQFFRRTVEKQKVVNCWRLKKCDIINGEKCRGCRLDKCLIEGMDPSLIKINDMNCRKKFIEMLEKRRNKLQLIIIKHSTPALNMLCNYFNSYELGSYTWMTKDGSSIMISISKNERFIEDKRLCSMGNKIYTNPIKPYYNIGITKKEFSLILALLCSNSDIKGLSESAKNILSIESSRYLKILLNYLQKQLGQDAGTVKFSECIHLIGKAYFSAKYVGTFLTYLEVFYLRPSILSILPNWLALETG
ncbi:hypothetical protein ACQ4LE_001129 [Meloidogyne hapla]